MYILKYQSDVRNSPGKSSCHVASVCPDLNPLDFQVFQVVEYQSLYSFQANICALLSCYYYPIFTVNGLFQAASLNRLTSYKANSLLSESV